ncbi:MAG: DUF3365 domain-containing protein, partial [Cohaesibacteraceae bacterium]|nr:DUF3365 domain-containing protein [Cohaesibacteraceae bacterium]
HSGQKTVYEFKTIRGYYTEAVVKKALDTGLLKVSINHMIEPNAIPLPATFIHDISALLKNRDESIKLYSAFPFPHRENRKLDSFQAAAWDYLRENPSGTYSRQVERGGRHYIRVAQADLMSAQGCVNCHNSHEDSPKTDWKLGDVRGVLEVTQNIDLQLAEGKSLSFNLLVGTIVAGLILMLVYLVMIRNIVGPLGHLRAAARDIDRGDMDSVVPGINRNDEIGDLARTIDVWRGHLKSGTFVRSRVQYADGDEDQPENKSNHSRRLVAEVSDIMELTQPNSHGNQPSHPDD